MTPAGAARRTGLPHLPTEGTLSAWVPGIEQATAGDGTRSCTLRAGVQLEDDIVTVDVHLRRFQYRITAGIPVERHLGTVDVLEDGDGSLVDDSTEIRPDALADVMGPSIQRGVQGLKTHLENTA